MSPGRAYGKYTGEFRETAMRRLRDSDNVAALCRELGISRQLLYQWRDRAAAEATKPDPATVTERQLRQEILKLKQALGEKSLQVDFLQGALGKIEALRRGSPVSGAMASTSKSGK
jgi:transposase-like protein